jgi:hypothetical protein
MAEDHDAMPAHDGFVRTEGAPERLCLLKRL